MSEEGLTVLVGEKVAVHQTVWNHNQSLLFSITYPLVTCTVDPYVHLDAGHMCGYASMSSVMCLSIGGVMVWKVSAILITQLNFLAVGSTSALPSAVAKLPL